MCLSVTKDQRVEIATEDIVCYKWLRNRVVINVHDEVEYETPYQFASVTIGETYKSELDFPRTVYAKSGIEKGLHSYADLHGIDLAIYMQGLLHETHIVAECIIPAGSRYYMGIHNSCDSYASDQLKYVRVVGITEYAKYVFSNTDRQVEVSSNVFIKSFEEYNERYIKSYQKK